MEPVRLWHSLDSAMAVQLVSGGMHAEEDWPPFESYQVNLAWDDKNEPRLCLLEDDNR